jgi:Tfp pilus assembly PilM family ATPase
MRTLKLPFSDRKKIDQVLPFELEGLFPFDTEEAVFTYTQLAKEEGEAELLVAAARKELVASRLETYRETGHEPRSLMLDAFALEAAWNPLADTALQGTTALLHVGPQESLLLLLRDDGYKFARALRVGYRDLVERASKAAGAPASEFVAGLASGAGVLNVEQAFAPLLRDVEATLRSTEKTMRVRPGKLVVSGAPAGWNGFADGIGQALRIPASVIQWPEEFRGETDGNLGDFAPLVGAAVQSQRSLGLDMRCGEFVYTRAIQLVKGKLMVTGAFAAALILLLILSNVASYFIKAQEADDLKAQMEEIFTDALPNEPMVDPVLQMKTQVRTMKGQLTGGGQGGIVDIFKGMSQAVGGDVAFKINEFHKDASGIRIKAETDSFEQIERIKEAIGALPGLKQIRVSDSKTTATGTVVFELTLEAGT